MTSELLALALGARCALDGEMRGSCVQKHACDNVFFFFDEKKINTSLPHSVGSEKFEFQESKWICGSANVSAFHQNPAAA